MHIIRLTETEEDAEEAFDSAMPCMLRLESSFCVGEQIQKIKRGNLVRNDARRANSNVIFASTNGSIGVFAALSERRYTFFEQLQGQLHTRLNSAGNFSHRLFRHPPGLSEEPACIDGDLIARYAELPPLVKDRIAAEMSTTPEELAAEIDLYHQTLA